MTLKKIFFLTLFLLGILFAGYRVWSQPKPAEESASPVTESNTESGIESSETKTPDASPNKVTAEGITRGITQKEIDSARHPLEALLAIADRALEKIDREYFDYTAILTNQVRYKGNLRPNNKMEIKIRHSRNDESGRKIPFSIYTKFLEPDANKGREVIWMEGWNGENLMVHLTGFANLTRISLDPRGSYAMEGNLYPVTMIGMRNLLLQIREKGNNDLKYDDSQVSIKRGLKISDRVVTMVELVHPEKEPHFEYHIARIYLDEALGLPVGYEGYLWPEKDGDQPVLQEKYFYTDIQLNVGLTDFDFEPSNVAYEFPGEKKGRPEQRQE